MKIYIYTLCFLFFIVTPAISQEMSIAKQRNNKFGIKASLISPNMFVSSKFDLSYGAEIFYIVNLKKAKRLQLEIGLGGYSRTIIKHGDEYGNYYGQLNFSLKHLTLELPVRLKYSFLNKNNKMCPFLYISNSPVLYSSRLGYGIKEIFGFFPEFNYNIGFGLGLNIKRNFTVGIEGNFFLIKQQEFIEWVEPGTVVPPTNYAKDYYKAISITGSFYF